MRAHRWRLQHQPALPHLNGEAQDPRNPAEAYQANLPWNRVGIFLHANGEIQLEVLFGEKDNHRREPIWFEVVDLNSPYYALLGRPALAKFMAVPHYAYLKMKLPGPRGVITVTGCYKKSIECARASSKLAEALVIAEEKRQLL
jgi:hypothetical protein